MLYFDNAATTWPKPASVIKAVEESFLYYGANPGRSGHSMGMKTSRRIFDCRKKAADFFGLREPENAVFTKNCTEAINTVLMSTAEKGGHIIISDLEHNSVLRPLFELKNRGRIDFSVAEVFENEPEKTAAAFKKLIRSDTNLIAVCGASNVFGIKLPVKELSELAAEYGIPFMLDASQTAGAEDIDMERDGIDFLCAPGHKGLLGPMGTGLLLTRSPELLRPQIFGGTGSLSLLPSQPEELPDMLESGTLNVPGISGLASGIEYILKTGRENIAGRELEMAQMLFSELRDMKNVTLFTGFPKKQSHAPVISFVMGDLSGEETSRLLSEKGIASRGGFHCSALAHRKMGTDRRGTCRLSIGPMNSFDEVRRLAGIIRSLSEKI